MVGLSSTQSIQRLVRPRSPCTASITSQRRRLGIASSSSSSSSSCSITTKTSVVALSGGVDSSVVASLLLQEQPKHAIQLIHMSNWNARDDESLQTTTTTTCSGNLDWKDAQAVAKHLQCSIQRLNFEREYWNMVFEPFVNHLTNHNSMGNPDMACNKYIKFGVLQDWCRKQYGSGEYELVTGHYARVWKQQRENADKSNNHNNNIPADVLAVLEQAPWLIDDSQQQDQSSVLLLSAMDHSKDQSYFLAQCSQSSLRNVRFPLGNYYKTATANKHKHKHNTPSFSSVRDLASQFQLPTAQKRDSMGICFIGTRKHGFRHWMQDYLPPSTTPVTFQNIEDSSIVGVTFETDHACLYTIGQGAKIGGSAQRYFVVGQDVSSNTVWVAPGTHHPALYTEQFTVSSINWINERLPLPMMQQQGSLTVLVRVRHLQPLQLATLVWTTTTTPDDSSSSLSVHLHQPMRGVTPGQFAAFYIGTVCLGGGSIATVGPSLYEQGRALQLRDDNADDGIMNSNKHAATTAQ
jgi:tRNA-specific 2-thiouridylase